MKKKIDSNFFKGLTIFEGLSFIFSIVLFIISIINIIKNKSLNNEFFEFFYFCIHLIIHFMVLAFSFKAINNDSFIIKPLTHNRYLEKQRSKGATIICSILLGICVLVLVYDILIYMNIGVYDFHFTSTLKNVLLAVSVFMILSMSAFIIYPSVYKE